MLVTIVVLTLAKEVLQLAVRMLLELSRDQQFDNSNPPSSPFKSTRTCTRNILLFSLLPWMLSVQIPATIPTYPLFASLSSLLHPSFFSAGVCFHAPTDCNVNTSWFWEAQHLFLAQTVFTLHKKTPVPIHLPLLRHLEVVTPKPTSQSNSTNQIHLLEILS